MNEKFNIDFFSDQSGSNIYYEDYSTGVKRTVCIVFKYEWMKLGRFGIPHSVLMIDILSLRFWRESPSTTLTNEEFLLLIKRLSYFLTMKKIRFYFSEF